MDKNDWEALINNFEKEYEENASCKCGLLKHLRPCKMLSTCIANKLFVSLYFEAIKNIPGKSPWQRETKSR